MALPITSIQPASIAPIRVPLTAGKPPSNQPFEAVLAEAVQRVESYQTDAGKAIDRFLSGEDEEIHKVALATQQAQLSFDLFLQAKNKVVQAYQEVMRMQL